jgi:hypothetical protein
VGVSPSANVAFSVSAAIGALVVTVLSAAKGSWVVTAVYGLLVVGFLFRATERRWRGGRGR